MKNIMNNNRMFNEIIRDSYNSQYESFADFMSAIDYFISMFNNLSTGELLNIVKQLSLHAGWSDYPVQIKNLDKTKTYVHAEEHEYMLSIYAYIPNNDCDDYYLGVYDLWKPASGHTDWKPWQDGEIFCKAYAALQTLQDKCPEVVKSGYIEL